MFVLKIFGFVANYKLTMIGLVTEMLTSVQNILTDSFTLDQAAAAVAGTNEKVGRAIEMFNLAAQVYEALDAYSEN